MPGGAGSNTARGALLVTGFEPFGADAVNPTGDVVRALGAARPWGDRVRFAVLPVTWSGAPKVLLARADHDDVDACLMFGVAGPDPALRLERTAWNLAHAKIPDNAGVTRHDVPLDARGPASAQTAYDVDALRDALAAQRVPAERSDDPGRYLCNATYYAALTARRRWSRDALFVHVPATRALGGVVSEDDVRAWIERAIALRLKDL